MLIYKIKTDASYKISEHETGHGSVNYLTDGIPVDVKATGAIKNDVLICRDLVECPILAEVIRKPELYKITELCLDRKGKVQIKRPIPPKYIRQVFNVMSAFVGKVSLLEKHVTVNVKYQNGDWEGQYTINNSPDIYTIVAKFVCMMLRKDTDTGEYNSPFFEMIHPDLPKHVFSMLDGLGLEPLLGETHGRMCNFNNLEFKDMHFIDCLPGKTLNERGVLQDIDRSFPQWRQGVYDIMHVKNIVNIEMSESENKFFVPEKVCYDSKMYDLAPLVSFEQEEYSLC